MKTLHGRCAGLDVHKVEVVACLRLVNKRKVEREVRASAIDETELPVRKTAISSVSDRFTQ